jgi:hypothetical protein
VRTKRVVAALWIVWLVAACETTPDAAHSRTYAKDGVAFQHPESWTVTEDVTRPGISTYRKIHVESPGKAIVIVQVYTPRSDRSVEEFAAKLHQTLLDELSQRGLGPLRPSNERAGMPVSVRTVVAGTQRNGVEYSFPAFSAGQEVPWRLRVFRTETDTSTVFLIAQAAAEGWDRIAPDFELVLSSFVLAPGR